MLLTKTKVAPGSSSTSATRSSIAARSWAVLLTRRKDSRSSIGGGGGAAGRRAGATLVARLGRSLVSGAPKRLAGGTLVASHSAVAMSVNAVMLSQEVPMAVASAAPMCYVR
jgi:hypothetical protein